MIKYFYVVFLTPLFIWIFIKLLYRNKTGAYVCDRIMLMIPVMGAIVEKSTVARTTRTLGTLVQSGVPILESLNIVRDTAGNAVFERAFTRIYESIREGETIAQPLRKEARIVDDIVVNMIDVGEETGELDTMLNKIADNYDEEVETAVESLVSLLEPIMIVVLGGIIGFIVIALFLPLDHADSEAVGLIFTRRVGERVPRPGEASSPPGSAYALQERWCWRGCWTRRLLETERRNDRWTLHLPEAFDR